VTSRANILAQLSGTEVKISSLGERQRKDPALDGELRLDAYSLHIFHRGNSTILKTSMEDELN